MRYGFIIVFNGAHTLRACAEHALRVVDKLIIVEGVVERIKHLSHKGNSTDGTLRIIADLQAKYSERVISIIGQAEFWINKDDMCNAALPYVTPGSWLIEFDSDEFYFSERLREMMEFLEASDYTCAEVYARHYYGSLKTHMPLSPWVWGNKLPWRRMFRYDGLTWESHTPPRLACKGEEKLFPREMSAKLFSVEMHHAAYIWHSQVKLRAQYFTHKGEPQWSILTKWERYVATGQYSFGPNGPVRYDGPQPWDEKEFE